MSGVVGFRRKYRYSTTRHDSDVAALSRFGLHICFLKSVVEDHVGVQINTLLPFVGLQGSRIVCFGSFPLRILGIPE